MSDGKWCRQTNHLSHFLLVKELYPLLEKAADMDGEARVVNHSSGARNFPRGYLKPQYFGKNGGSLGGDGSSMICGGARWYVGIIFRFETDWMVNVAL